MPSSVARELMSRHFGLHKARLLEATVTDIHTGKQQEGRRAMLTMATAPFRWSFPPAWGDSLRTLTDIQRETVFVSVEKVTRMRGSRGGPLPEVGPHGVGVGDAKGRAKGNKMLVIQNATPACRPLRRRSERPAQSTAATRCSAGGPSRCCCHHPMSAIK